MNKGTDLRVSRSLELLNRLKGVAATFAKKEEQVSKDFGARRYSISRAHREATAAAEAHFGSQTETVESKAKAQKEQATALFEQRQERIDRFYRDGIRHLPLHAQQAKESWMGNLQMRDFHAKNQRTADLAAALAAFNTISQQVAAQRAQLADKEQAARRYFQGYRSFLKLLETKSAADLHVEPGNEAVLLQRLQAQLASLDEQLLAFRRFPLARLFSYMQLPVLILLLLFGVSLCAALWGWLPGVIGLALSGGIFAAHQAGWNQSRHAATAIRATLSEVRRIAASCEATAQGAMEQAQQQIEQRYEETAAFLTQQWNRADHVEEEFETTTRASLETKTPRVTTKNELNLHRKLDRIETERATRIARIEAEADARRREQTSAHDTQMAQWTAAEKAAWDELQADWQRQTVPVYEALEAMNATVAEWFPAWSEQLAAEWTPPRHFLPATKFGQLEVDLAACEGSLPKDPRLALPGSARFNVPLALAFPSEGSLVFETTEGGSEPVMGAINQIILRLLSTTPPGKISFTILDPVGLGENFAGLMQLSDYEESLINRRIWTQRDQIEERLAELCEHIEKVIQMYLRNQYATITEYNEQAGSVAEKYHFLVVADFPAAFSETAAARLQSIATSGARCGVFTLLHWDKRQSIPEGFSPEEIRASNITLRHENGQFLVNQQKPEVGVKLTFDAPPAPDLAVELTHKIGKSSIDSNRVEVPFAQIAPAPEAFWTNETSSELRIAIGRTGATKHQILAIGKGTRQHALFAGKTGSGKSTLFHVIITNLALACSPDQVEFYLIDFKKGVEFKCYAEKRLPHAKVVAIESDREFALSVLERVDEELKRRGDLFRKLGVQDVAGYKRAGGTEPMPRSLLIIDEFQEFFVEDDAIAQTASLLFDRIVRQGRAFGIHVLLGSQSLGGAYSLARATLGQMVIRVALQCNEADAYLIMDDTNPAPRLLSRPGEGIYNDAGGALEGNSPFQVVWLPDDERDLWLDKIHTLAEQHPGHYSSPIVFEGNAPADIRENALLAARLAQRPTASPAIGRAWLGAPNSIKGPTEATFQAQSGSNLLVVGQRDEAALNLLGLALVSLAAQYPVGGARFVLFHAAAPGTPDGEFIERLLQAIPHEVTVARTHNVAEVMNELSTEFKARTGGGESANLTPVYCFIHGLQKFKKLRNEDEFSFSMSDSDAGPNPGAQFTEVITEGASHGIHLIVTLDTLNNVNRFLNRKALSEFEMRVVFQMSANDSASLIDSPKASGLGLHRALYYNEHEGSLETFRPYATPDAAWIQHIGESLAGTATPYSLS